MAVSHVFTNAVADATGTLTIWYGATTATVAATDIVRPGDWNSAHNGYSTFSGNTAGASTWSGTNLVLAATNNLSLSLNGNTLSVSGPDLTQFLTTAALSNHGHGASAANGSFSFQTLSFSNANGVSFGTSAGSAITASHNGLTSQSNQAFSAQGGSSAFQTLSFNNANGFTFSNNGGAVEGSYTVPTVTNSSWTVSDNASSATVARLAFTNLNGVTLSLSTGAAGSHTIVGSHNALTSQSNQAFSADGGSSAFQTLNFRNANGISFSNSDGSVQASYTVPTVPAQLSVGNSNLGNTAGDTGVFTGRVVFVGSDNITLSGSSNGGSATVSIIGAAGGGGLTNIRVSAGTTSNLLSAVTFANGNGVSFGLDASTITASIATSLTNMRVSAGTTSNLLSAITFANGNGVSFGLDASTLTGSVAAQTNQTGGIYVTAQSTGQSSSSTYDVRTLSFVPDGIISAGWSNGSFRVSATQSNQNVTAANGGFAFQTLSFSNANGVSFGTSAGSAITGSVAAQTNQSGGIYALGNTTGQSSSSTYDARTLSVEGAGIVSVGWSNSSLRISATQSNQAFSAGAASSAFQTLVFQDSNGISFSNNAGSIRATYTRNVASNAIASVGSATNSGTNTSRFAADDHVHAGVFSMGVSNVGNSAGDTRVDVGRFVLAGGANVTLSQATAANALNTISIVGPAAGLTQLTAYAQSNTTQSTSGTIPLSSLNFHGAGIASVGVSNGSVIISVPAGGGGGDGGVFAGVSTGGNTAGSTGTVSTGNFVLVGSRGVTLSQSTAGAGSHATVSILGQAVSSFERVLVNTATLANFTSRGQASLFFEAFQPVGELHHDRFGLRASYSNASNSTASVTLSMWVGIYTRNAGSLSLLQSTSDARAITGSGSVGNASLQNGIRLWTIPWTSTIPASSGPYWLGLITRSTTGGANASLQQQIYAGIGSTFSGVQGAASNATKQSQLGHGVYTASTTSLPGSVAFSQINGNSSAFIVSAAWALYSSTQ